MIDKCICKIRENRKSILDALYLLFFAMIIMATFRSTVLVTYKLPPYFVATIHSVFPFVVFFRILEQKNWSKKELIIGIVFTAALYIACFYGGWAYKFNFFYAEYVLLVIGAYKMDANKIIKVFLVVSALCLVFIIICSLYGKASNLIYFQAAHDNKPRLSFGVSYTTDFASHVLYIVVAFFWIRNKESNILDALVAVFATVFCYYFCDTRTSCACIILIVVYAIGMMIWNIIPKKENKKPHKVLEKIKNFIVICMTISAAIFSALMIVLSIIYNPDNSILKTINRILNGRLKFGHYAFQDYTVKLWGQWVSMQGNGGTTLPKEDYFFLDSSYINVLFRFGLIVFVVVILAYIYISYCQVKEKEWFRLWILFVCAITFAIEHHLLEIAFNPFFVLLLTYENVDIKPLLEKLRLKRSK